MHNGKNRMSLRMRKRVQKTVRKDMRDGLDYPPAGVKRGSAREGMKDLLKTQTKKRASIEGFHLNALEKSMERKKAKRQKKHSKRTDPKDAIVNSAPAHVHAEGTRWIKTITKKNRTISKEMYKKTAKRK